jgi:hypothetical protein
VIVDTSLDADDPAALAAARERWARFDSAKRIAFLPRGVATLPGPELAQGAALIREQLHPRSQAPGP